MPRILSLLLIVLAPLGVFAAMIAADRHFATLGPDRSYVIRLELPPPGGAPGLPRIAGPLDASRPLVVIDAGHGGHDPGAGNGHLREKELTLGLARALRDRLLGEGGVRVAMTRDDDRYLLLEERSGIARRLQADLFVSIHADSAGASEARGATLYTLSSKGSSEEAERLAASENRADTVNGVALGGGNEVDAILVDLAQRQTEARSAALANLILREGAGRLAFRDRPVQSAAFVVLKSPDTPSVLFEAGYISNPADAARLASQDGRRAFADVTARAIRVWLARQSTASP
ncbi:MAG: N-acetylmuramoyl-L-alanine amidase [Sphingomonadales bacterium]|nr:N-acetylmuramoyl-L-alanine amidase [Sphingomonadales bacterium]